MEKKFEGRSSGRVGTPEVMEFPAHFTTPQLCTVFDRLTVHTKQQKT
jgi:hypothetical protein